MARTLVNPLTPQRLMHSPLAARDLPADSAQWTSLESIGARFSIYGRAHAILLCIGSATGARE
jgi:hypothetical protein